jgi:hypothetical protein
MPGVTPRMHAKYVSKANESASGRFDTKSFRYNSKSIRIRYTSKVDSIHIEVGSIQTEVDSIQPPFTWSSFATLGNFTLSKI